MNPLIQDFPGFKKIGHNTYKALCPVHDDNSPSLHITDKGDCVLMHCFACLANGKDVCDALGFDPMVLLFNKEFRPRDGRIENKISARDALECLTHEILVHGILAKKEKRTNEDNERMNLSAARIVGAYAHVAS